MRRRDFMRGVAGIGWMSPWSGSLKPVGRGEAARTSQASDSPSVAEGPDYAALLAQHDVVYLSPTADPAEGLPIGNGDLVGMVWMPPQGLELAINKSNLWDDRPGDPPLAPNWSWDPGEEERWTALVSGCRLAIRNNLPLMDPLYLDDFQARLSLYEAQVQVASASPLGRVKGTSWISAEPGVLVVDYEEKGREAVSREIELSRWGSRRFFHWYSQYDPLATSTGLEGTQAGAEGEHVWIEQKLRGISFAVVMRWAGGPNRAEVVNRHVARLVTERAEQLRGQVYLAIVTSEEDPSPLAAARRKVDEAAAQGYEALLARHRAQWGKFWAKSYIQIPEDYLENLYYTTLYQLAVSSRGAYPPPHCGGLWFWNRDVRRWGHYYHWDLQQQYWPVDACNHGELARPYLEFRFRTLPEAEKYARNVHNRGGAFYSDVTDRIGRGTIHQNLMHVMTAGPQIAMDFWRHYLYTQDREFLRTQAYPVMKACAQFYLETVERDAEDIYHIPKSTAYENYILQKDTITDLASIRQSFPACIKASEILGVDRELRERWREGVAKLVEFTILQDVVDENGRKLSAVFSSGLPLEDQKIEPDANFNWKTKRMVKKGERQFNISFNSELAPVFPSGVVGLAQRGTEMFDAAVGTTRGLAPGPSYSSTPVIAAARLGLGEDALAGLVHMVKNFQMTPQGFWTDAEHYAFVSEYPISIPPGEVPDYSPRRWDFYKPRMIPNGKRSDKRALLPTRWFDMPDLEVGGPMMTTLQEMLLQSHDGVIRMFPAMPATWKDAHFRLRAVGAFLVTGERRSGEVQPFVVESLRGGACQLENPWLGAAIEIEEISSGRQVALKEKGGIVTFETQAGSSYVVLPTGHAKRLPQPPAPRQGPNQAPKVGHTRRLGIPRYF